MEGVEIRDEPGMAQLHLRQQWWDWPTAPPGRALVAYIPDSDGTLGAAAVIRLFYMQAVSPGGTSFRCYGVGGVYTSVHFRGRGLASALLERADAGARERGAGVLALFAVYGTALYLRAGYVPVAQAGEREHLWLKSVDEGLAVKPGSWRLWPEGHF